MVSVERLLPMARSRDCWRSVRIAHAWSPSNRRCRSGFELCASLDFFWWPNSFMYRYLRFELCSGHVSLCVCTLMTRLLSHAYYLLSHPSTIRNLDRTNFGQRACPNYRDKPVQKKLPNQHDVGMPWKEPASTKPRMLNTEDAAISRNADLSG